LRIVLFSRLSFFISKGENMEAKSDKPIRIKRELMYKGSILDIYKDTMQLPDGGTEEWDFVSHRLGAAAVLPVMPDGRIVMVRQYRNALGRETIEIPAGSRDSRTEDTAVCAARELEEETGYRSENIEYLLSLRTTVAFCDEFIDVYLATGLKPGERHLDEGESIDVELYTIEELCDKVYAGEIQDSKTVAAIMAYSNKIK
jgi:ADP-ribose pyrophosphatase